MSSFSSTVLVTGGCGFIGSNFVNYLLSQQGVEKVINYDNLSQGSNRLNVEASERCIFVCGDVSNGDLLGRTLHLYGVDRVVHFAALTHVGNSFKDPGEFVQNNVQGTLSLLESVRKYSHIKLLLYISTDEVYGESGDEEGPKRETDSLHPTNPYSASKLAAEKLIEVYLKAYKIPSCIVRMCNVFGPRQGLDKMFPKFIRQAASDEPFTIEGDGSQLRSWMYVLDACEAIHTVFQQGGVGSVYNIGSTCEVSVLEAAMAIKKEVFAQGKGTDKFETISIPDRPFNDRRYYMDSTKLRDELGWSETTSFEDGLKATVSWYLQNMECKLERERVLVYGGGGWIGGMFCQILQEQGVEYVAATCRVGDDSDSVVREEILQVAPSHVASFLGRAFGPGSNTIDYLEGGTDKLVINLRDNLFSPMLLAEICRELGIHFTYIGTGCIFDYTNERPYGSTPFTENDTQNFFGSSYSVVKGCTDRLIHHFSNTLNVRIRFPITYDSNKRNVITKLASYPKILSIPNSVTVLPELLPVLLDMMRKRHVGTINLVNRGPISHQEILSEYVKCVDPTHTYELVEEDSDFGKALKSKRSNCYLDTSRLEGIYPKLTTAKEAVSAAIRVIAENNH